MVTIVDVYDIECLSNLFTYTGYDYKNDKWVQFVISEWRNDYNKLIEYLSHLELQVGYNNEAFDYPVIHHLINHYSEYCNLNGNILSQNIYLKAQEVIEMEFSTIADKNKFIQQVDLFKIWHYNNKARMTSLKDLEVAMKLDNVEEMPIHHTTWCKKGDEICVLAYNKNDVFATNEFRKITLGDTDYSIYKGKNKFDLRIKLKNKFGIPCINYPDVKIGESLMLHLYSKETGIPEFKLKKSGGTYRNSIALKECIPYWCKFETKEFNYIKKRFEDTIITNLKGDFSESIIFHGCKMDYGQGGLHSCVEPGIYEADDYWMILDEDVGLTQRLN